MKRWTLALVAMSAVGLALFFTLVHPGGSGTPQTSAHVNTGIPHIELDVVEDGTGVWCNPVHSVTSVNVGVVHKAAICLSDALAVVNSFGVELNYDSDWNSCADTNMTGMGLDANPDANVGATVFSGSSGAGNLGTGCDCSSGTQQYPTCDYWPGPPEGAGPSIRTAYISCVCTTTQTLPHGAGVSHPLAVVTYTAAGAGVDTLSFGTVSVYMSGQTTIRSGTGATVTKLGPATPTPTPIPPTATETPTPLPTATFTPLPTPYADIDKIDNGDGWCDPVDDESTEVVGDSHSLAVCAHNMPQNIGGFDLHISYDNGLDGCTEIACTDGTCVNDNPELAGDLGAGWNCTTSGQPVCNIDSQAYIHCNGPASIQSGALAVLNLDVIDHGIDNVIIDSLVLYTDGGLAMAECGAGDGAPGMPCFGATDTKVEATPTPTITNTPPPTATPTITQTPSSTIRHRTATPKPTATEEPTVPPPATSTPIPPPPATPTPLGGVGTQLVPPETGSGSTGGFSWLLALLAGTAGIAALAGGGFYLRFARRRVT